MVLLNNLRADRSRRPTVHRRQRGERAPDCGWCGQGPGRGERPGHSPSERDLSRFGLGPEDAVSVSLAGTEYVTAGDAAGGTTAERIVLVETRTAESIEPRFVGTRSATLPRRTQNVTIDLSGADSAATHTVQANGAVVLHDHAGLTGSHTIDLPRYETATLTFLGPGSLSAGDVEIEYWPPQTRKAILRVTVDRWGDSSG